MWNGAFNVIDAHITNASTAVFVGDYAFNYGMGGKEYGVNPLYLGPHQPGTAWGNAGFLDGHASWVHFKEDINSYWYGDNWTSVVW